MASLSIELHNQMSETNTLTNEQDVLCEMIENQQAEISQKNEDRSQLQTNYNEMYIANEKLTKDMELQTFNHESQSNVLKSEI